MILKNSLITLASSWGSLILINQINRTFEIK
jgi:hypothetical protein